MLTDKNYSMILSCYFKKGRKNNAILFRCVFFFFAFMKWSKSVSAPSILWFVHFFGWQIAVEKSNLFRFSFAFCFLLIIIFEYFLDSFVHLISSLSIAILQRDFFFFLFGLAAQRTVAYLVCKQDCKFKWIPFSPKEERRNNKICKAIYCTN